jgi:hypothetical protein
MELISDKAKHQIKPLQQPTIKTLGSMSKLTNQEKSFISWLILVFLGGLLALTISSLI